MRFAFLVLMFLCFSACLAKRFLQDQEIDDEDIIVGGFQEVDLKNPNCDFLQTFVYLKRNLKTLCHINSSIKVAGIKKASVQIVAGKNYEFIFNAQNHENEQITVNVFQSLPDENRQVSYEITSCA